MSEAAKTKRPRGRPRIHANDNARKAAYEERQRVAKRGAAIVEKTPESSNAAPLTVAAKVIEQPAPSMEIPTPLHPDGSGVPEAGSETPGTATTSAPAATGSAQPDAASPALDPKVMTSLVKGVFALVALRGGEHWKVEDDEIEPIAEPMCRQASRIPIVAALGQDAADIILIGSTLGALIFMRAEQTVALKRQHEEARRRSGGNARIYELRPEPGQTERVAAAGAGERYEEVREPNEPRINLGPFQASG